MQKPLCFLNFYEPIALDYRTVVCPFIDVIAYDTFEYRAQDEGARGAFDWEFFYKRLPILPKDEKNMPEPFESPVMAGGLFAISRKFFWELGGYDPGLDIWGGEQYELSFKIWQCGGRMVDAPCSRVGHIYRKFAPFPNPGHGDFVGKNYRRVAEVWMDEYAQFLYARRPHYRNIDPGDISEQKALRQRLQCKVSSRNMCWDLPETASESPIKLFSCHLGGGNQLWKYLTETKQIKHGSGEHCIEWRPTTRDLFINTCDLARETQRWTVDFVDKEMMAKWTLAKTRVTGPIEDP
ncbi:hypothetical protein HF086_011327 [Spodoptera exigua]|uniref:Uncharacterized protein n=1 Tax=Spodoptera exigua TaxID=7107 RepID=A0A922M340_SPOEX|nr:hypothetical protein HF086_011327 [Spodoptera exigua]